MKNKSTPFILCLFFLLSAGATKQLKAQTAPSAPRRFDIYMAVQPGDMTMHKGDTLFHENTRLSATAYILLSDTSNIAAINLTMGTTDGGNDLFQKSFADTVGTFVDGTSLTKKGNKIYIGMGNYTGVNTFYARLYLANSSGGTSATVKYAKK